MSIDTEYCHECGLLHDPQEGDCQGCELVDELVRERQHSVDMFNQREDLVEQVKKAGELIDLAIGYTPHPEDYQLIINEGARMYREEFPKEEE